MLSLQACEWFVTMVSQAEAFAVAIAVGMARLVTCKSTFAGTQLMNAPDHRGMSSVTRNTLASDGTVSYNASVIKSTTLETDVLTVETSDASYSLKQSFVVLDFVYGGLENLGRKSHGD